MKIYGNVVFLEELVFYEKAVMYNHRKKKIKKTGKVLRRIFLTRYSANNVVLLFARHCQFLPLGKKPFSSAWEK